MQDCRDAPCELRIAGSRGRGFQIAWLALDRGRQKSTTSMNMTMPTRAALLCMHHRAPDETRYWSAMSADGNVNPPVNIIFTFTILYPSQCAHLCPTHICQVAGRPSSSNNLANADFSSLPHCLSNTSDNLSIKYGPRRSGMKKTCSLAKQRALTVSGYVTKLAVWIIGTPWQATSVSECQPPRKPVPCSVYGKAPLSAISTIICLCCNSHCTCMATIATESQSHSSTRTMLRSDGRRCFKYPTFFTFTKKKAKKDQSHTGGCAQSHNVGRHIIRDWSNPIVASLLPC